MRNMGVLTVFGLLLMALYAQPESEFASSKKRATPSAAVLKEQIVDQLALMLKKVPELLRLVACQQEQALQQIEDYASGAKGCFFDTASKQQLAATLQRLERQVCAVEELRATLAAGLPLVGR